MSSTPEQRERVLAFFDLVAGWARPAVKSLADDPDAVLARSRVVLEGMLDELPYLDRPDHVMAGSMFATAALLAVFEVLRERGVDAHRWGRAVHELPTATLPGSVDEERTRADAAASQAGAAPNEFVFEIVDPDAGGVRGMNITSCAVCHLFGKRDAMDLVPYMCALDDAMSQAAGDGLRRTGTIALGASHCDFRYETGGTPRPLAPQYPDRIRL